MSGYEVRRIQIVSSLLTIKMVNTISNLIQLTRIPCGKVTRTKINKPGLVITLYNMLSTKNIAAFFRETGFESYPQVRLPDTQRKVQLDPMPFGMDPSLTLMIGREGEGLDRAFSNIIMLQQLSLAEIGKIQH